jgi:asparagine synthase (glutamine-hydrolysing)
MPRERAWKELHRMVEVLRHEPFYTTGTWADEASGIYVGWAALKNSFSDDMPLCNEQKDVVLVFSGEEFPVPGTPQRLKQRGHVLEPEGPSYLVHACEEDPSFPSGLNGKFHGVLADRKRGTATLFNDRYGMHRLYYHESKDAFYFAAEAKAILTVRPELRAGDPRGLGELISCGCVLENRTLFKGIHLLPTASAWTFQNGALQGRRTYFQSKDWEDQTPLEPEHYYQEFRTIFSRNLPRYFQAQEPIGVSLTGGLDTRMVMAWQKSPPGSLPCYTFGGMFRDCMDVTLARQVADSCRQPHRIIPVGEEFLSRFPHYAERAVYLTDGCIDVSHSPDLYINERARGIAPVRMTGNYGGEVLRGIRAFKPEEPPSGLFRPDFLPHVQKAAETYSGFKDLHPVSFAVSRQTPWHHYGLQALEQTQVSLRTPFLDNDLVRLAFRAPQSVLADEHSCLRLIADGNPALCRIGTDRGPFNGNSGLTGAASRKMIKFLRKAEYAYDYGMPQWVAGIDHMLAPLRLERLFLGRQKFYHFRVWYRDQLSRYVREMLLDPRTLSRPYLERRQLETMVEGHLRGNRNYTTAIHKVLTLELIHRLFIES